MSREQIKVGLVGNPNVGKSTVFNALTGMKQHTGNWPGKTVDVAIGNFQYKDLEFEVFDLPGTYSLISHSKEEEVTREFICKENYDVILIVCDAVCLERNLNLLLQILDVTSNVVVAVNLIDEAEKKHIEINYDKLCELLETPVFPICARDKKGLKNIIYTMYKISKRNAENVNSFLCAECEFHSQEYESMLIEKTKTYLEESEKIAQEVVNFKDKKYHERDLKIDKVLTNKITGVPIMLLLLGIIFWITIVGANYPSQLLFELFQNIGDILYDFLAYIKIPRIITNVLLGGGYKVLTWVVAVMLPPMAIFFPLFTILEDLGVLPRIAFNLDNAFRKCNACGKQALTMCMGFGCNACGITGTRIIDSPRDRLIAILTNNFVPCNGRFPTIISIITIFLVGLENGVWSSIKGISVFLLIILFSVISTFWVSKILSRTILKGETSSFTLELPPYRTPKWGSVIVRSVFDKTLHVLWRAVIVAFPAGILIWFLTNIDLGGVSIINHLVNLMEPLGKLMGLDGVILLAFILGFPAKEIVLPIALMIYMSSGELIETNNLIELKKVLVANGWTIKTAICTIIFSLMHWSCSTICLTIYKETKSIKWTLIAILLPTISGIIMCSCISQIYTK